MPLMKYFGLVGSALVLLLIGIGWFFPQPVPEPIRSGTERPLIRISSVEQLPERVMIDTSLPTIVPPPSIGSVPSIAAMESAQQRLQGAFAELDSSPSPTPPKAVAGVLAKTKSIAKREPAKKVVAHRAAQPLNIAPAPSYIVQARPRDTRMSLLETLKERLGQALFRFN